MAIGGVQDSESGNRITFGLYGEIVPKTVMNFVVLCDGSAGIGNAGKKLWYKDTPFHRIIPGFMA